MEITSKSTCEISAHPGLDIQEFREQFFESIGFPKNIPSNVAIAQLLGDLFPSAPENEEKKNYLLACVATHQPGSLIQAQILVQLLVSHTLCSKMLQKASSEIWPDSIDKYANIAIKLSRNFKNGMEALAKCRKGVTTEKDDRLH
jgi:hypothetical protein